MLSRFARLAPTISRVCRATPMRALSTLPARGISQAAAVKKTLKVVSSELEHEESSYAIDESFQPFMEKSGFNLVEADSSPQITLTRQVGDTTVEITFLARTPDNQPEEEEQQGNENQNYVDFQVQIQKSKLKGGLFFECSSQNSEVSIVSLMYSQNLEELDRANIYFNNKDYRGPDFSTLDDKLQASLIEYLQSFGVNDELGSFIESYSLDKEQRLYMGWLSSLKRFLS